MATARTIGTPGHMHITRSHISKAGVNPYYGREIPDAEMLGLKPDQVYKLLRSPEELEKAAPTFARLPILNKHVPISSEDHPSDNVVGAIGSDVEFNDPFLDADTGIWTDEAIAGIETNVVREFSCAYHYIPVMIAGTYQGEHYDGIMTAIRGNHLALVEAGRAGPDVLAADEDSMKKKTKLGTALSVALSTAFPKLAEDAKYPALFLGLTSKNLDKGKLTTSLLAMDASIPTEKVTSVMDAISDMDEKKPAKDAAHDEDCDCAACKKAAMDEDDEDDEDAEDEPEPKPKKAATAKDSEKEIKGAMDSFKLELREANDARVAVRPVVGDVIAQDSALDIYGFALDTLKVDYKGVDTVAGRRALFNLSQQHSNAATPRIAADAAATSSVLKMFPGTARIRRA